MKQGGFICFFLSLNQVFDDDKNDCKWSPVDLVRALLWFFFWYLNSRGSCGARVFFFLQGLISTKLELVIAGAVERRNKVVFSRVFISISAE